MQTAIGPYKVASGLHRLKNDPLASNVLSENTVRRRFQLYFFATAQIAQVVQPIRIALAWQLGQSGQ